MEALCIGADPDPAGATVALLSATNRGVSLLRWGLVRAASEPKQHPYQLSLAEFAELLPGAIVGIEVIENLIRPRRQDRSHLRATQAMGNFLATLAEEKSLACYTFPGHSTLSRDEAIFTGGAWQSRLTGLRRFTNQDLRREILASLPGIARRLDNPHLRDALGVGLLAIRLAQREQVV